MSALSYEEQKQKKRKEAAYHEAAHVFMLALFGHQITSTLIREEDNVVIKFSGETNYSPYVAPEFLEDLSEKHAFACIAISGSSSEDKIIGYTSEERGLSIVEGGGSHDDWIKYNELALEVGSLKPLIEVTNKIIDDHWEVVSELAEALYHSGTLNSQEIESILKRKIPIHPVSQYLQAERFQYEKYLRNITLEAYKLE